MGAKSKKRRRLLAVLFGLVILLGLVFLGLSFYKNLAGISGLAVSHDLTFYTILEQIKGFFGVSSVEKYSQTSSSQLTLLQVSTKNPRYLEDANGKIVYLTGSHTWNNIEDFELWSKFNNTKYLDMLVENNHSFTRLWQMDETYFNYTDFMKNGGYVSPMPFKRTGPGNALDGRPKFNLSVLDQDYYDRLRQRVIEAGNRGIYVSIMFYDGVWVNGYPANWKYLPYNPANNVNGYSATKDTVYTLTAPSSLRSYHEAYVKKVVDTVNDLDNVIYEVGNEMPFATKDFQYHIVDVIKNYEATKPKQHVVGMTSFDYQTGGGMYGNDNSNYYLFNGPGSWISPFGIFYNDDMPRAIGDKVIILDSDHVSGFYSPGAQWIWKSFTRGHNPIYMDPYSPEVFVETPDLSVRKAMGYTKIYADKIGLANMVPSKSVSSTTYALANPGQEYLIYQPSNSGFNANLVAGNYQSEWFNPANGLITKTETINAPGGNYYFAIPSGYTQGAVLYLLNNSATVFYNLTVNVEGSGSVISNDGKINCPTDCTEKYAQGTQVTLTATPLAGYSFNGWSGGCSGSSDCIATISLETIVNAAFVQSSVQPDYASGLLMRWNFDESSGVSALDSAGSNNGQLLNGVQRVGGKIGSGAVQFDGTDDAINYANPSVSNFGTSDFSISAWIKTSPGSKSGAILSKRPACDQSNFYVLAVGKTGNLIFSVDQDINGKNYIDLNGKKSVRDNSWHHIAAVRKANVLATYVDGALDNSQSGEGTANLDNGANLQTGNDTCGWLFAGAIDDLRVYSRALSSGDVLALYQYSETPSNQAPSVSLDSPVNGTSFTFPASIQLTAGASDSDGAITKVEFYSSAELLGTDTTAPYTFNWNGVKAGSYSLYAKATDDRGATAISSAININVNNPGPATYTLLVNKAGSGSGAVSGTGLACFGNTCSGSYSSGTSIALSANANADSAFEGWSGDCLGSSCTLKMNGDKTATATFSLNTLNISQGTLLHYNFDEGNGNTVQDLSGNSLDGTLIKNPKWTSGKNGKALLFDGNYVQMPLISYSSLGVTLSAWINMTLSTLSNGNIIYIGTSQDGFGLVVSDGACSSGSKVAALIEQVSCGAAVSKTSIQPGQWTHVALTNKDSNWKIYINGVEDGSGVATPKNPTGATKIGAQLFNSEVGNVFYGSIDEARVYNRALNSSEISTLYSTTNAQGSESMCPNGIVENLEVCDSNSQACNIDGYLGSQACNLNCNGWNSCISSQRCGDGIKNGPEVCDGNSQSCIKNSYAGTQACNPACSGFSVCTSNEKCGDGIKNGNEQCDDGNLKNSDSCTNSCVFGNDCKDNDKDGLADYDVSLCPYGMDKCIQTGLENWDNQKPVSHEINVGYNKGKSTSLLNASDVNLSKSNVATVLFKKSFKVIDNNSTGCFEPLNISKYVKMEKNTVFINTSAYSDFNQPAVIIFEDVKFVGPKLLKDGLDCPIEICNITSYNTSSSVLVAEVSGFSTYQLVEGYSTPPSSPQNNVGGGGSGGSGGGTGGTNQAINISKEKCVPELECSYSECVNGQQNKSCFDKKGCSLNYTQKAIECLGLDELPDTGQDIHPEKNEEEKIKKGPSTMFKVKIYGLIIFVFLIVIAMILAVISLIRNLNKGK